MNSSFEFSHLIKIFSDPEAIDGEKETSED